MTSIKKDFSVTKGIQAQTSIKIGDAPAKNTLFDSSAVTQFVQKPEIASSVTAVAGLISKVYDSADLLPLSGNAAGDFGFVNSTNRLYLWNGSGWYNIALINSTPTLSTTPDSNYAMDSVGASLSITILASDPEEVPIAYSYLSDSASNFVTITQDSGVFTISPLTQAQLDSNGVGNGGTFTITFRASDGINIAPAVSSFTLSLGVNWAATLASPTEVIYSGTRTQNDSYGIDVSIVGNTAVVGTSASVEGVDVYSKSGGSWTHVQRLLPTDTNSGDQFGLKVLITPDESTIIVSAPGQDDGQTLAGKVYCFTESGGTWSQASAFQAPNPQVIYSTFGRTIAISPNGNILAVGQPGYDTSTQNVGRILIYTGSGSSWTYRTSITPADTNQSDQVGGTSLALSNDTVVIGSINHKWGTASTYYGAAWVWTGSGASWSQQQKLDWSTRTSPYNVNKGFGITVDISGDEILVGANGDQTAAGTNVGSIFAYTRSGSTWTQQQIINNDTQVAGDEFGGFVKFSPDDSDIFFTRASSDFSPSITETGEVIIFQKSGGTWSRINTIANPGYNGNNPSSSSGFGSSLDVDAENLLIGSPYEHTHPTNTTWNTGGAYFYEA